MLTKCHRLCNISLLMAQKFYLPVLEKSCQNIKYLRPYLQEQALKHCLLICVWGGVQRKTRSGYLGTGKNDNR